MIDLCSTTTESSGDDEITIFSPVKSDPADVIKQIIPNVNDNDYHDPTVKSLPVLARPKLGLTVNQLFTLMIGTLPVDHICHRKPTSVTYNGVFVVDLSCVHCIDDFRADVLQEIKNYRKLHSCVYA